MITNKIKYVSLMKTLLFMLILVMISCTPQGNPPNSQTNTKSQVSTTEQFIDYDKLKQVIQDEKHLICQKDSDCTKITTSACGISFPTNLSHQHHAQHYSDNIERAVGCEPPTQTLDDFNVICQNYQCTLIEKNPTQK